MLTPYLGRFGGLEKGTVMLEPSAGNGAILDWLNEHHKRTGANKSVRVYCIEKNPDSLHILSGKGHKVLTTDFLKFTPTHQFNLIAMNPPFSNGDEHLLHAWEILHGGDIVCLLNAETINNPHTERRKLLKRIIDGHGTVEFLGSCFEEGARKTDVNVAMVRLKKPIPSDGLKFQFTADEQDAQPTINGMEAGGSDLAHSTGLVDAMSRQYSKVIEHYGAFVRAMEGMAFFSDGLISSHAAFELETKVRGIREMAIGAYDQNSTAQSRMAQFQDELRSMAWASIIERVGMEKVMTSALREKFATFVQQSGSLAITRENVYRVLSDLGQNVGNIMATACESVFDGFTKYHEENRVHVEGWKSNSSWKVNKKVILPHWIRYDETFWNNLWRIDYGQSRDRYTDIDKVCAWLAGKQYEDTLTIEKAMNKMFADYRTTGATTCDSEFFQIRVFKKGTVHLIFKNEYVWNQLNLTVAKARNWIGG